MWFLVDNDNAFKVPASEVFALEPVAPGKSSPGDLSPSDSTEAYIASLLRDPAHRAVYDRIATELKAMTREELFADIEKSTEIAKRHYDEVRAHVDFVEGLGRRVEQLASDMKRTHRARGDLIKTIDRLLVHKS